MSFTQDRIIIDPRIYDISRKISIRGTVDALVELVTNSYDAYRQIPEPTFADGSKEPIQRNVYITTKPESRMFVVYDTAVGVTGEDFKNKILTAGSMTSVVGSRGLMGRGLKDISAIGSVTIRTVKDNKFSRATIHRNLTLENVMLSNTPPDDLWEKFNIAPKGTPFFHTTVEVDKSVEWISDATLIRRLRDIVFLRNEKSCALFFNGTRIRFEMPKESQKRMLSSFSLKFPNYEIEGATTHTTKLTLYQYPENLVAKCKEAHPDMINERKDYAYNGIEISSGNTTYEISDCSDGSWNANGYSTYRFIHGTLEAPIIDKLARDLFENGATEKNPFLIFDPNRREGLNRRHPFIKLLFAEIGKWVRHVLKTTSNNSDDDAIEESGFLKNVIDSLTSSIKESIALSDFKVYTWQSKKTMRDLKDFETTVGTVDYIDDLINNHNPDSTSILPPLPQPPALLEESLTPAKPEIGFQLVTDPDLDYTYRIKYEGEHITVYLNSLDPALSTYVTYQNSETGSSVSLDDIVESASSDNGFMKVKANIIPSEPTYVAIGMVVKEAITDIQTRNILLNGTKNTTTDDFNSISEVKKEAYETFRPQISRLFKTISAPRPTPPPQPPTTTQ